MFIHFSPECGELGVLSLLVYGVVAEWGQDVVYLPSCCGTGKVGHSVLPWPGGSEAALCSELGSGYSPCSVVVQMTMGQAGVGSLPSLVAAWSGWRMPSSISNLEEGHQKWCQPALLPAS